MNEQKAKGLSYHWVILVGAFLIFGTNNAFTQILSGVFGEPVTKAMTAAGVEGFTIGAFSLCSTICAICIVLAIPVYTKLMAKGMNTRLILIVCVIMHGVTMIAYAFAQTLVVFYIISALRAVFSTGLTLLAPIIVTNWFEDKRGFAMGLMLAGSGILGALVTPIISSIILAYDWQTGYIVLGTIAIVSLAPFTILFLRMTPEEKGLQPYRHAVSTQAVAKPKPKAPAPSIPYSTITHSNTFVLSLVTFSLMGLLWTGCQANAVAYFVDIGYEYSFATSILAVCSFSMVITKPTCGYIFDKCNIFYATIFGSMFIILAVTLLILSGLSPVVAVLFGVCLAVASAIINMTITIATQSFFGIEHFNRLFAYVTMVFQFGYAIGMAFPALLFDALGSYTVAWLIFLAVSILVVILMYITNKSAAKLRLRCEANTAQTI